MEKRSLLFVVVALFLLALFAGCQKKTTKVAPVVKPAVEEEQPKEEQPKESETKEATPKEESESKVKLEFETVYFDYDKADVRSDQRDALALDAQVMKAYPKVKVLIAGHCDERGTIEYNLALGDRRANAVKTYLVNYGIDPDRISTISYGKEKPVDPDHTEAAWAKNRRAEFKITAK